MFGYFFIRYVFLFDEEVRDFKFLFRSFKLILIEYRKRFDSKFFGNGL